MTRLLTEGDLDLAAELATATLVTFVENGEVNPELGEPIDKEEAKRIGTEFLMRNAPSLIGQSASFVKSFANGLLFPDRLEQFTMQIRNWSPVQLADLAEGDADEAALIVKNAQQARDRMIEDVRATGSLLVRRAFALGLMMALRETGVPTSGGTPE